MNFIDGYKTYIVAGLMAVSALACLGIEAVSPETLSGTLVTYWQDLLTALSILFLRRGVKSLG